MANPLLPDPNFDRTVVMLLATGEEGALGLVLNRPSHMDVGEPLPQWEHLAAEPAVLFLGGPVQHQAVICLGRNLTQTGLGSGPGPELGDLFGAVGDDALDEEGWDDEEGWKEVAPGVGTVDLDRDPDEVIGRVRQVRLFAGYAGWAAGQLEAEIEAGAWWVVDAQPEDAFTLDPETLWTQVLRRQPFPLAFVSYYPDDPRQQ